MSSFLDESNYFGTVGKFEEFEKVRQDPTPYFIFNQKHDTGRYSLFCIVEMIAVSLRCDFKSFLIIPEIVPGVFRRSARDVRTIPSFHGR